MLIAMGVVRQQDVAQSWEDLLQGDGLQVLHQHIQDPRRYLNALHYFGPSGWASPLPQRSWLTTLNIGWIILIWQ